MLLSVPLYGESSEIRSLVRLLLAQSHPQSLELPAQARVRVIDKQAEKNCCSTHDVVWLLQLVAQTKDCSCLPLTRSVRRKLILLQTRYVAGNYLQAAKENILPYGENVRNADILLNALDARGESVLQREAIVRQVRLLAQTYDEKFNAAASSFELTPSTLSPSEGLQCCIEAGKDLSLILELER